MYQLPKKLSDALKQSTPSQEIEMVSERTKLTGADLLPGTCTVDRYCLTANHLEIGTAIASELKFTLRDKVDILGGEEFRVSLIVNRVSIPMGCFTVDSPTNSKQISALDRMVKFDVLIDNIESYFPSTLSSLVASACSICGVSLAVPFLNSHEVLQPPGETGVTWRHIVQWAAGISGECAYIDWDGKLRFQWLVATDIHLTSADRFTSRVEEPIETDSVQIVDVINYTSGAGRYPISLKNNMLIQSDYQGIADSLYSKLGNISYTPFTCTTKPYPHIYPLDVISFTDLKGNTFSTIVTHVRHKLNGRSLIEGVGESGTRASYAPVANSKTKTIAEVRRRVSEQEASLELVTSWKDDATESLATLQVSSTSQGAEIGTLVTWKDDVDPKVSGHTEAISTLNSTASSHGASIESLTTWKGEATSSIAQISQVASDAETKISLLVDSDSTINAASIVASINDSESSVIISADHVSLYGKSINLTSDNISISSTNFSVSSNGTITAKLGKFGGWDLGSYTYGGHTGSGLIYKNTGGSLIAYFCPEGLNHYTSAFGGENTILGVAPNTAGTPKFAVTTSGKMFSTAGSIGGWSITTDQISSTALGSTINLYSATGSDTYWIEMYDSNTGTSFNVRRNGKLRASNVDIAGSITAREGNIAGYSIQSDRLLKTKTYTNGAWTTTDSTTIHGDGYFEARRHAVAGELVAEYVTKIEAGHVALQRKGAAISDNVVLLMTVDLEYKTLGITLNVATNTLGVQVLSSPPIEI